MNGVIERVKDWKSTLLGLVVGLAIITATLYAMHERPQWGWPELLGFASGLGTILWGALTKSQEPAPLSRGPGAP